MAASKRRTWNGIFSGSILDEDKSTVASVQNKSNSAWRLADIKELCDEQNKGAGSRRDDPYLEEGVIDDSQSSITEYLRPRNPKGVLPRNLIKWTTSATASASSDSISVSHLPQELSVPSHEVSLDASAPSFLPSESCFVGVPDSTGNEDERYLLHSQGKWRDDSEGGANDVLESNHLPDYIEQFEALAQGTDQKASFLNEMEMQGAAVAAGGIDKDLYQNLVEMIPLMESFMDQRGNQRKSFSHHASLVYTPAPPRDGLAKKVQESHYKINKNKQQKSAKAGDVKGDCPIWEEQENVLKRFETENSKEGFVQSNDERPAKQNSIQLQNQIEELKHKLLEKEKILQSMKTYDDVHDAVTKTNELLQSKVEELQQELRGKENLAQSVEVRLSEKQHELENMNALLGRLQGDVLRKNEEAFRKEEEMDELRCQVTALRYQLERIDADDATTQAIELDPQELYLTSMSKPLMQGEELNDAENSHEQFTDMESARRMYLAAVVAAREKPGEEALTLAAELRKQLQAFLVHPLLCKKEKSFNSQTLGFPLL